MNNQELNELKDHLEMFKQNPVWAHLSQKMMSMHAEAAEAALNSEDMTEVKFCLGIAHAVKILANFDENIPVLKAAKGVK